MSYNIPERSIEPPEDKRPRVYSCAICDEAIREGDDYYDIPDLGPCCEDCIRSARRYDAEIDREED